MHASSRCVSHASMSIEQALRFWNTVSLTNRLSGFKEWMFNNVNSREEMLATRVGEENWTLRIAEKCFLVLHTLDKVKVMSIAVVGSNELLISRENMQVAALIIPNPTVNCKANCTIGRKVTYFSTGMNWKGHVAKRCQITSSGMQHRFKILYITCERLQFYRHP